MTRLGWVMHVWKEGMSMANLRNNTNIPPRSVLGLDVPQVSLPHVETRLNMHQFNGLFEPTSPEPQNESSVVSEPPAGWLSP